jgi:polyhydroxyalkanoate synthesis regulator phasin
MRVDRIEEISQDGAFAFNRNHDLDSVLQKAIDSFEATALRFSVDAISDAKAREAYQRNSKRLSDEVLAAVKKGEMTVKEGAEFCQQMRNQIMEEIRVISSPQGRAYAERMKPEGRTLEYYLKKYSKEIFDRPYSELTAAEQSKVHYAIVESAGRPNVKVNAKIKRIRVMGKVFIVVTAAFAAYSIGNAENKAKEIIKQGSVIGGGFAGGAAGGVAAGAVCGPGAVVCTVAIVLIGSIVGGLGAGAVVDSIDDELEEFTKWNIF